MNSDIEDNDHDSTETETAARDRERGDEPTEAALSRRDFLAASAATASAALLGSATAASQQVEDLVGQMTREEKLTFVTGTPQDGVTGYLPGVARLDVPAVRMTDGPLGVTHGEATAFPANITLASTFDPEMASQSGAAMGREAKAVDGNVLLAPALNVMRTPLNGRTFEYYSEDPAVTRAFAASAVDGIQSENVMTTAKHFAVSTQQIHRRQTSANVSQRALREIYLPGFEGAIVDGEATGVMTSYNRVNDVYTSEHEHLLTDLLETEWGFDGFSVSDWGGQHSAVGAAHAGHNVEMPGGSYYGDSLVTALDRGWVSEETLDDMVRGVLNAMEHTGALDGGVGSGAINTSDHQQLSQDVAERGAVLLQNDDTLPLDTGSVDSVAVIGPSADEAIVGGRGSSAVTPPTSVDPLTGIEDYVGDAVDVSYHVGTKAGLPPVPSERFETEGGQSGLSVTYYDGVNWDENPVAVETTEPTVDLTDTGVADRYDALGADSFSARMTGSLQVPEAGEYELVLTSDDGSYLWIDGEQLIDNGGRHGPITKTATVQLDAGAHDIRLDWVEATGGGMCKLQWVTPGPSPLQEAENAASEADAAIVVSQEELSESIDRADMQLPGDQNALISRVAGANPNTVVALTTGAPVTTPWADDVASILQLWYPGMFEGDVLANLLFGEVNPSGKTPITWGKQLSDYPPHGEGDERYPGVNFEVDYDEGIYVGYRWFDREGIEPQFPFGHGESYTSFGYGNLTVAGDTSLSDPLTVSVDVTNTGDVAGREVVQLYASQAAPDADRPPKELVGFDSVELAPDETATVSIEVTGDDLEYWHPEEGSWVLEDDDYEFHVGASAGDIRLRDTVTVSGTATRADESLPQPVGHIEVTDHTATSLSLAWEASESPDASAYRVYVDGEQRVEVAAGETTASVTDLTEDSEYVVGVRTVDDDGNESAPTTAVVEPTATPQAPYNGPHEIPGRVSAADFDTGGTNIAYKDDRVGTKGSHEYRPDTDVSFGSNADGVHIGDVSPDNWYEYTVQVQDAGTYEFHAAVAGTEYFAPGALRAEVDGEDVTGILEFGGTGGWTNWAVQTASGIELTEGEHTVRIHVEAEIWNFDWFAFLPPGAGTQAPYDGAHEVPGRIHLEDFDEGGPLVAYSDGTSENQGGAYRPDTGVDIHATGGTEDGYHVGNTQDGEWLEYTVSVDQTATYDLSARVTSAWGGAFHVEVDSEVVTETTEFDATGGWSNWSTVDAGSAELTAGEHVVRFYVDTGGFNADWLELTLDESSLPQQEPYEEPHPIPGRIQAERFDIGGQSVAYYDGTGENQGGAFRPDEAVDISATSDSGGQYHVGNTQDDEWLEYTVSVDSAGTYDLSARVTSAWGGAFHVEVDGEDATETTEFDATGGWSNWSTVDAGTVELTAGEHVVRFYIDTGGFNLNWFALESQQPPLVSAFDEDDDGEIDDSEVESAIDAWGSNERIEATDGDRLTDSEILDLIERWHDAGGN